MGWDCTLFRLLVLVGNLLIFRTQEGFSGYNLRNGLVLSGYNLTSNKICFLIYQVLKGGGKRHLGINPLHV